MKKYFNTKNIIIAILAIIIVGLLIFIIGDKRMDVTGDDSKINENINENDIYLIIAINPKLMLQISDNIVKNVYQLNEDAIIFTNDDLQGLSLEKAVEKVSKIAKDNNYLKEDTEVSLSYYNSELSDEINEDVEKTFKDLGIKIKKKNISKEEKDEIKNILDNYIESTDKKENEEPNKDVDNKENQSNSNNQNNSNSNNSGVTNDWENIGNDFHYNAPQSGSCIYSMRGVNFTAPSWFTLYEGDRWATQKEYNRVNPDSNRVVYIRNTYNGYDNIGGNDGIYRYYGTFLQFLPDNIECLKNLCPVGDKECYEERNYIERTKLQEEKSDLQANESLINSYQKYIVEMEDKIKKEESYIEEYCSEMTSETEKCVYKVAGTTSTWWSSIAEHKANIEQFQKNIENTKISIQQTQREVHYQKLRVYQQQKIYDYVKENFQV